MNPAFRTLLCSPLVLAAAGCSTGPRQSDPGADSPVGSWQLVGFTGGDHTRITPRHPERFTLRLDPDGSALVRMDCNRGRSTWKSSGPGNLEFGPLALTRAWCPDPVNDLWARHWEHVRSYVLRDGRLHLSLAADAGIYEFQPAP